MLKDIVVNLSLGAKRDVAGDYAISIAQAFDAHVTAIAYRFRIELPGTIIGSGVAASIIESQQRETEKLVADAAKRFGLFAANMAGIEHAIETPDLSLAEAADGFGTLARAYDLAVVCQPQPDRPGPEELMAEATLFGKAGRPAMVVPYIQKEGLKLNQVTVCLGRQPRSGAGGGGRDAVSGKGEEDRGGDCSTQRRPQRCAAWHRHCAASRAPQAQRRVAARYRAGTDIASTILSHVADSGSDFLVMGGYGHSRLREFIVGGVTRDILGSMTVPTLMSH